MSHPVDVSVVIVNWNTRELLLGCIESLLKETRESSLEIIIVDNASADNSVAAVRERFPSVTLVANSQNLGFSKANNQGLRVARGRYVCLVNSDVVALDGVLDRLRAHADAHPEIGAIAPRTIAEDGQLRQNCREYPTLRAALCQALFLDKLFPRVPFFRGRTMRAYDYSTIREIEVLSGCFLMVRREAVDQVGLLDERFFIYSEDVDWCKRLRDSGWKLVFYPPAQAIHFRGASSAAHKVRFNLEQSKANLQYWLKHHGRLATLVFWTVLLHATALRLVGWACRTLVRPGPEALDQRARYWTQLKWLFLGKTWSLILSTLR